MLMCFPIHALYSGVLMLYKDQLVKAHIPSLHFTSSTNFYELLHNDVHPDGAYFCIAHAFSAKHTYIIHTSISYFIFVCVVVAVIEQTKESVECVCIIKDTHTNTHHAVNRIGKVTESDKANL